MKYLMCLLVIALCVGVSEARPRLFQRSVAKVKVKTVQAAPAGSGIKSVGGCVSGKCSLK